MAAPRPDVHAPRRLTRAEYDRMVALGFFQGERLELIHGTLLRMPPIGPPHATAVSRLTRLLVRAVGDRAEVRIQQPLIAHDESEPEPDVAVVPAGDYSTAHPAGAWLVIEVADSSLDFDRSMKAPLYAASGVGEYWIVALGERAIEVHAAPGTHGYATITRFVPGERVALAALPEIAFDVADVLP